MNEHTRQIACVLAAIGAAGKQGHISERQRYLLYALVLGRYRKGVSHTPDKETAQSLNPTGPGAKATTPH